MADEGLDKKICSVCNFMVIFFHFQTWIWSISWVDASSYIFFSMSREKQIWRITIWTRFNLFFCHALSLLSFTGSLAFTVGGDTVISSCTWKRESQRRYYFNLCRIFTKKDLFLWKKNSFLGLGFFSPLLFSASVRNLLNSSVQCL